MQIALQVDELRITTIMLNGWHLGDIIYSFNRQKLAEFFLICNPCG